MFFAHFIISLIFGLFGYFVTGGSPTFIWPWEGSNYPSRSCNGPNGPKGPKFKQNKRKAVIFSAFLATFFPGGPTTCFGLERGPTTPPGLEMVRMDLNSNKTKQKQTRKAITGHSFISFSVILSHILQFPRHFGPSGHCPTCMRLTSNRPPRVMAAAVWGAYPDSRPWQPTHTVRVLPRRRPTSPDQCHPHILHHIALEWPEQTKRAMCNTKNTCL